jgi:hypothetical protein
MTDQTAITRLATALGWEYKNDGEIVHSHDETFYTPDVRALDAFVKAAEAALTKGQQEEYGKELLIAMKTDEEIGMMQRIYRLVTAPAEIRLACLVRVVEDK